MIHILADQAQRDRLRIDLGTTLFVEAAAGTGKTTMVVTRVVAAIAAGRIVMEELVAITFTIAAAGDLRVRIRLGLEEAAANEALTAEERMRCRDAAEQVERARIETIHAFCSALLRMHPLEAALPPDFDTLDQLSADIAARERFRQWFDGLTPDQAAADPVRRALLLGLKPSDMQQALARLNDNWDLLDTAPRWETALPANLVTTTRALGGDLQAEIERRPSCRMSNDGMYLQLGALGPLGARLSAARTEDEALASLRPMRYGIKLNAGTARNWPDGMCASIKAALGGIRERADELLDAARTACVGAIATELRDVAIAYARERRSLGVVSYHDMLVRARDLVRDHAAVRDTLRRQWKLIVVDEFQDTDPLQAELAFLLASDGDPAVVSHWTDLPLRPGALCLVGDPKQSIYRFRRADIALHSAVKDAVERAEPHSQVTLQVNFRSGEQIVDAVNAVFGGDGGLMTAAGEGATQAAYVALVAHAPEIAGGVHVYGGAIAGKAADMWREEARATAAVITNMLAHGWLVGEATPEGPRPCMASDICILMPSRTNLRNLERALEDARIRYRLESGALMIATQEVRDLLNCLRAIDDPTDEVATVAALRSPAFGCSDLDLLHWHEAGGRWSYLRPGVDKEGTVADGMAALRELHMLRHERSAPALVDELTSRRLMRAAAADTWRPREVLRRLRYARDEVAAIGRTGRATLHDAIEHLEQQASSPEYDKVSTGGDDEDCVRVMTIHAAKGLEFPVAIVTGLGVKPQQRQPLLISDRTTRQLELRLRSGFTSSGYNTQWEREKLMDAAERQRLLYVALTRARDHLVVSLHRGKKQGEVTDAYAVAERLLLVGDLGTLSTVAAARPEPRGGLAGDVDINPNAQRAAEDAWEARRTRLVDGLSSMRVTSATALAHQADAPEGAAATDSAVQRRGRGATSLGRAVHAVLQVIDLLTLEGLEGHAAVQAAAEGVPERAADVERLVRSACATEVVQQAARARHWRELPVGASIDGVTLEGFIDLLYELDDGSLAVVDYKTDAVTAAEIDLRMEVYRTQGGTYALTIEATTSRRVEKVEFVFATPGVIRSITDVDAAIAEVLASITLRGD